MAKFAAGQFGWALSVSSNWLRVLSLEGSAFKNFDASLIR